MPRLQSDRATLEMPAKIGEENAKWAGIYSNIPIQSFLIEIIQFRILLALFGGALCICMPVRACR
jgi:hypothetical protein